MGVESEFSEWGVGASVGFSLACCCRAATSEWVWEKAIRFGHCQRGCGCYCSVALKRCSQRPFCLMLYLLAIAAPPVECCTSCPVLYLLQIVDLLQADLLNPCCVLCHRMKIQGGQAWVW